jgi:hypothetical protein
MIGAAGSNGGFSMLLLVAGIVVFLVVAVTLWRCLPRNGEKYRFADTAWEPYIGVALTAGLALGTALALSGIFQLVGT